VRDRKLLFKHQTIGGKLVNIGKLVNRILENRLNMIKHHEEYN